jgi:DNA-directed RNA polymerase specialized sigma54-like protein
MPKSGWTDGSLFYRTEILRDQGQFKTLLSKTAKLQKNMKQSQEKVDVLNEQLSKVRPFGFLAPKDLKMICLLILSIHDNGYFCCVL